MPAILDSLFHKVVDTTSTPIGVEGGDGRGATKWRDLSLAQPTLLYAPLFSRGVYKRVGCARLAGPSNSKKIIWPNSRSFWLHISQNVATSTPSLTSQSCGDSAGCLPGWASWSHLRLDRFWGGPILA